MPSPFARFLAVVRHLPDIAVVFVHALHRDPGPQSEAKDEVFPRRDALDLILRFNEFCTNRLPGFVKPLCELALETGDTVYRLLQFRIGYYLLRAGSDVAVVKVLRELLSRGNFTK